MGAVLSQLRLVYHTLKAIADDYNILSKRISLSPGIPELNSSIPYWTIPPSPIARHGYDADIPLFADVVIIGSGITGTSVAKVLLEHNISTAPLKIVMLEARDACSGATGRNGGHMSPNIYNEYTQLKTSVGSSAALQILRFRLAHIPALISAAREENLLAESQAREVDEFDVFLHHAVFDNAKKQLDIFVKEIHEESKDFRMFEDRESIDQLQLSSAIIGCIQKPGAAIHPYRFVTGILSNLLERYPNFQLFTRSPCIEITSHDNNGYIVRTPRGEVRTPHIIHATNAWSSHLLPGMRRKIVPTRVHMSTQRPGRGLMDPTGMSELWAGKRAFVFYPGKSDYAFDYLTQQPPSSPALGEAARDSCYPCSAGEFMFGGGAMLGGRAEAALFDNIGITDDGVSDFEVDAYLGGALERYFSNWGPEGTDEDTTSPPNGSWGEGRIKAFWTGIMGISADLQPWVGRVPMSVSGRREPVPPAMSNEKDKSKPASKAFAPPGEWIAAGYSGEGMVHAWLSGKALAHMVLGVNEKGETVDLPPSFLITEKRWKQAKIETLMETIGS